MKNPSLQEQYQAPELTLIGKTRDVVRGVYTMGGDIWGERIIQPMEFEPDDGRPGGPPPEDE